LRVTRPCCAGRCSYRRTRSVATRPSRCHGAALVAGRAHERVNSVLDRLRQNRLGRHRDRHEHHALDNVLDEHLDRHFHQHIARDEPHLDLGDALVQDDTEAGEDGCQEHQQAEQPETGGQGWSGTRPANRGDEDRSTRMQHRRPSLSTRFAASAPPTIGWATARRGPLASCPGKGSRADR
jgi:hypothetical protein